MQIPEYISGGTNQTKDRKGTLIFALFYFYEDDPRVQNEWTVSSGQTYLNLRGLGRDTSTLGTTQLEKTTFEKLQPP